MVGKNLYGYYELSVAANVTSVDEVSGIVEKILRAASDPDVLANLSPEKREMAASMSRGLTIMVILHGRFKLEPELNPQTPTSEEAQKPGSTQAVYPHEILVATVLRCPLSHQQGQHYYC